MTAKRREELRAALADSSKIIIYNYEDWQPEMSGAELRALLENDERLERIREWADARKHLHGHDDHYYRGVGAAAWAILDRIPATPEKEPTAMTDLEEKQEGE